ncbi:MAG: hypothetical protein RJP96_14730 [Algiphilus sp.]|uniref:hypothetical protein n=1 Tax=Algiphilus sp. TaxID=1872431 RepID=UPI0032EC173B
MTVKYYSYQDADAPVLDAQPGSLVALLDACLIDGYSSGGTEKTPLGWQIAHTGTDKRAYQSTSQSAFPALLRIQDDGSSSDGGESAQCRAYDSMSDVDTGGNSTSEFLFKKSTGSSGRPWFLVGDDRAFYLCVRNGGDYQTHFFGDIIPQDANDTGAVLLKAGSGGSGVSAWENKPMTESNGSSSEYEPECRWLRDVDLIGNNAKVRFYGRGGSAYIGEDVLSHPNPVTGDIPCEPLYVGGFDNSVSSHWLRGRMPGGYEPLTNYNAGEFEIISGVNSLSGRDVVNLRHRDSVRRIFVDITGPWR